MEADKRRTGEKVYKSLHKHQLNLLFHPKKRTYNIKIKLNAIRVAAEMNPNDPDHPPLSSLEQIQFCCFGGYVELDDELSRASQRDIIEFILGPNTHGEIIWHGTRLNQTPNINPANPLYPTWPCRLHAIDVLTTEAICCMRTIEVVFDIITNPATLLGELMSAHITRSLMCLGTGKEENCQMAEKVLWVMHIAKGYNSFTVYKPFSQHSI